MSQTIGIPRGAAIAISDMLDNCAEIKAGDEVVIQAHIDGLHGGDNLVDAEAIAWIQAAVQSRGANASILWIDDPRPMHHWRVPPMFMAALKTCNVLISHSFDLTVEELRVISDVAYEHNVRLVRNLASTTALLNSDWAQTPYELLCEIRYQAALPFQGGMPYHITDDHGTDIQGFIAPPNHPKFPTYTKRRNAGPGCRPFPEWVYPPINIRESSGTVVFDRTLSWWSRYIGISPVFKDPIRLTVENNRVTKIEGKQEADALRRFLKAMEEKLGQGAYNFPEVHSGVHPHGSVPPQQCSNPLMTRLIEHSDASMLHFHIGAAPIRPEYPYWMHLTVDLLGATWKVGDQILYDKGHMTALDHPKVKEIAAKYPDRPGLGPLLRRY